MDRGASWLGLHSKKLVCLTPSARSTPAHALRSMHATQGNQQRKGNTKNARSPGRDSHIRHGRTADQKAPNPLHTQAQTAEVATAPLETAPRHPKISSRMHNAATYRPHFPVIWQTHNASRTKTLAQFTQNNHRLGAYGPDHRNHPPQDHNSIGKRIQKERHGKKPERKTRRTRTAQVHAAATPTAQRRQSSS